MKAKVISVSYTHLHPTLFAQPDTADFVVFSAINTMQKEWDELAEVFNPTKFEQHYGRNVTKGEIQNGY